MKAHPVWPALLSFVIPIVGWSLGFILDHDVFAWIGLFGGVAVAALCGARMLWSTVQAGDAQVRRGDVRAQLAEFIGEAETLKEAVRAQDDLAEIDLETGDWHERVAAFVRARLGEAFAVRLFSDPAIRGGEPFGLPIEHLRRWRWLNCRVFRLREFARELA